jgi:Flp pilus assembly protein TadG
MTGRDPDATMRIRRWRDDRGAVLVEFALIAPVLILLLFGIVEYGLVFNAQLQVTGAARTAARTMAVTGNPVTAQTAAIASTAALDPVLTTANVAFNSLTCTAGTDVKATVTYDKPFITGLFGAKVHLTGTGTYRCQG